MAMIGSGHAAVLGAGSWGTALALVSLDGRHAVRLWARRPELAAEIAAGSNESYLPGVPLPPALHATSDLTEALDGAAFVILAVPCAAVRENCRAIAEHHGGSPLPVLCVAKGLERGTGERMSQVMADSLPDGPSHLVLLGPSHAEEVAARQPTAVVMSGGGGEIANQMQGRLATNYFRIYTNDDLIGIEYAAALKNVLAIAAGICDGLGLGDNTKGALLTRGVAEIARLGTTLGGRRDTFYGLSGIGDVITTCLSQHSRNRAMGERVALGMSTEEALESIGQVVEGVETARTVTALASEAGVEMPISEQVGRVLFDGLDPRQALEELMTRSLRAENEA